MGETLGGGDVIRFDNVEHHYGGRPSLVGVDFQIEQGEFVFLTGPTGAGKSTLLRLILGRELCREGRVSVFGRDLASLGCRDRARHRRKVGVVFQDFKLLASRTVRDNVALVLRLRGVLPSELEGAIRRALVLVGLDEYIDRRVKTLSGGEQQRVAIARAIVASPPLLMADEPTGNLDPVTAAETMHLFLDVQDRGGTVIVATHNLELVRMLGQRVIALKKGQIVSDQPSVLHRVSSSSLQPSLWD